ncbi:MAG: single-stranded-DNA-specific exonuclease RecJ [Acidobacteriota bacterium]
MRWVPLSGLHGRRTEIALRHGLSGPAALLLAARFPGGEEEVLETFLDPSREPWPDPCRIPGLQAAAERVAEAVRRGEKILVHGDYDVDGLMGAAILAGTLSSLGAAREVFIPSRFDGGYGLSETSLEAVREAGASLVLTTDCGTNSREAGEALAREGVDLVVTDHHLPMEDGLPPGWVVNPHLTPDHPDGALCGASVALQFARRLGELLGRPPALEPFLRLAAIATIADVSPLSPLNRRICREGLAALPDTPNPALARMVRQASAGGPVMGHHVAYHLAPRFNAAGRMEDARIVLDLLLERDPVRAAALAGKLDRLNAERKALQAAAFEEASAQALEAPGRVVFAFSGSWHRGVLGPVAARLAETHRRSSFVVGLSAGTGTGSARAFGADNVMDLLAPARHLLERFGGHAGAAGFSVREERIGELKSLLEKAPPPPQGPEDPFVYIPLPPEELPELWDAWRLLDPFGPGNEEPVLGLEGIRARGSRVIKDRHILWDVLDGQGKTLSVIAWDGIPRGLSPASLTPSALLLAKPSPENRRKTPYPFYLNLLDIA